MSRRARAIVLGAAALACAALAAALGESYVRSASERFGPMTEVLVAAAPIERGAVLSSRPVRRALAVRRIPAAFVPADALASLAATRGLRVLAPLPEGAFVLGSQLRARTPGRRDAPAEPPTGHERSAIRIAVAGLDPRLPSPGRDGRVDVVASSGGKPRVIASGLRVIELAGPGSAAPGIGGERSAVTLSASRPDALRLIAAEASERSLHLIASRDR